MPAVPTHSPPSLREQAIAGFVFSAWFFVFLPQNSLKPKLWILFLNYRHADKERLLFANWFYCAQFALHQCIALCLSSRLCLQAGWGQKAILPYVSLYLSLKRSDYRYLLSMCKGMERKKGTITRLLGPQPPLPGQPSPHCGIP